MVGRERRDVTIAPGGNENDTKSSFDGSDDDGLSFDEDETAAAFLSSGDDARGQTMSEAVQSPYDNNTDGTKTTWAELCQEMTETTCEHRLSTKVWDERQNLQVISRSEGYFKSFNRCRADEERGGFDDRRELGPKEKKAAYFHNLIDRWKSVDSFGEAEVDRGWVKPKCEFPKQCWRPTDDQVTDG